MKIYHLAAIVADHPDFEPVIFDLEDFDNLTVVENDNDYIVFDNEEHNEYHTIANSKERAIAKYIDWFYGMVEVWEYDKNEEEYVPSDKYEWASSAYYISEREHSWETIMER